MDLTEGHKHLQSHIPSVLHLIQQWVEAPNLGNELSETRHAIATVSEVILVHHKHTE